MNFPVDTWDKHGVADIDVAVFLTHFNEPVGRVLCVGADETDPTPVMLTEAGFDVTVMDLRDGSQAPDDYLAGCKYIQADLSNPPTEWLRENLGTFDLFVSLSTIEHFGFAAYGEGGEEKKIQRYLDVVGMRMAWLLLKEGGRALITVPFGRTFIELTPHWRCYHWDSLHERLIQDFQMEGVYAVIAGDLFIGGVLKKAGDPITTAEAFTYCGEPPHVSVLAKLTKVPVNRLAPGGR